MALPPWGRGGGAYLMWYTMTTNISEEGSDHLPSKKKYSDAPSDVAFVPHTLPTTSIITRRKLFNCVKNVPDAKKTVRVGWHRPQVRGAVPRFKRGG